MNSSSLNSGGLLNDIPAFQRIFKYLLKNTTPWEQPAAPGGVSTRDAVTRWRALAAGNKSTHSSQVAADNRLSFSLAGLANRLMGGNLRVASLTFQFRASANITS